VSPHQHRERLPELTLRADSELHGEGSGTFQELAIVIPLSQCDVAATAGQQRKLELVSYVGE
jgi:hypothetical protein